MPTVGSLFSGIGGFDLGLERAGWEIVWQVENDEFRQDKLKRQWPQAELRDDIRTDTDGLTRPDLICGGFPCQDLSFSGRRDGLAGKQSSLWFEFLRVVRELRPTWVFIENVPGLLSSHEGKDMEIVVEGLTECGFGLAFRILDSKYFGIAQERRRLYIVGYLGAPCPFEVLFEPESLQEPSTETGEAKKEATRTAEEHPNIVFKIAHQKSNGWGVRLDGKAYTLDSKQGQAVLESTEVHSLGVREDAGISRFLDGSDTKRYKALGDAVTVPVIEWIGGRILKNHYEREAE